MLGPPAGGPRVFLRLRRALLSLHDFEALCDRRAARARVLAGRFPEASEALRFYGAVALFQKNASPATLLDFVAASGPELLREAAQELDAAACRDAVDAYASGADRRSPKSFFGRVLLQAETRAVRERCPVGDDAPQLGCLVGEGDGTALMLSCAVCFHQEARPKERCPACDAHELVHYHAPELKHLEVQACDACRRYINVVRVYQAPDAVPDVDEIAALPLDVWAADNGYEKLVRNLVGL